MFTFISNIKPIPCNHTYFTFYCCLFHIEVAGAHLQQLKYDNSILSLYFAILKRICLHDLITIIFVLLQYHRAAKNITDTCRHITKDISSPRMGIGTRFSSYLVDTNTKIAALSQLTDTFTYLCNIKLDTCFKEGFLDSS